MAEEDLRFRTLEKITGEHFDSVYREGKDQNWANAVPEFVELYRSELESDNERKVLDLGCGQGRNLTYLAENGFDAYGIDISPVGIKLAQEKLQAKNLKAHLTEGSFFNLPYQKDSFKAVFSNATLQGLTGPDGAETAFAEVSRVLKENGLFFLYVISKPIRQAQLQRPKALGIYYYSRDFLEKLANDNSLSVESVEEEIVDDDRWDDGKRGMWKAVFRKNKLNR